jgi:hypothetical protein
MQALKYLLMILGAGLFGSSAALVTYDIFIAAQLRRLLRRNTIDESGADLDPRTTRSRLRNHFALKVNFLGDSAGHGLR